MDGESGGACPQIESKFHSYTAVWGYKRRNETTDAALINVLVDRPHRAFTDVHRNVGILGDTWQILGGMSTPVNARGK